MDSGDTRVAIQDTTTFSLVTEVKERQYEDPMLAHYRDTSPQMKKIPFEITGDGVLRYRGRLCVPNVAWLRRQADGQAEHTIQTLEDMLQACAIDFRGIWDDHLLLIEFAYNNSYHSSIQMAPYEDLYGRKSRSPIAWFDVGETKLVGPELCIGDPSRVVPVDDVQVTEYLSYEEAPIAILDRQVRILRTKGVASVKVIWRNKNVEEMTWEAEEYMKSRYPHLFSLPEEE
ncbi:uncharacterized protein [Nicotiana tomentosiformis]|uniref:uncharacterized protein n=1 Tax=Nicotiana tomentosiformis TaxID=4098 RepID=UPI00388CB767